MSEDACRARDSALVVTTNASGDDRLDPSVWRIAAVALFGGLLAQLDATIVNISLSTALARRRFTSGASQVSPCPRHYAR